MTVADESFGQPSVRTHWPGASSPIQLDEESSTRPFLGLYIDENRVGPPTIRQEADNVLDFFANVEYTGSVALSMFDYDASQIQGNSVAITIIWARLTPILRAALVCGSWPSRSSA